MSETEGSMRARRWRRVLLGSVGIVAVGVAVVWLVSERSIERRYETTPVANVTRAEPSAADVARGRHLVTAVAQCTFCHGDDLAGKVVADDPWIGRIDSGNLTRGEGGVGRRYSAEDWVRALRHGVRPDGTSLLLMPARGFSELSGSDLRAIVAYLEAVPPVDRNPGPKRVGWLTRVIVAAGLAPDIFSAEEARVVRSAPRGTAASAALDAPSNDRSGAYLVEIGNCRVCHKADLRGGLHPLALPGEPPPPPLVGAGAMPGWHLDDFRRAMREGRTPDGRSLDPEFMPWPAYQRLTDKEIEALWRYLAAERPAGKVVMRR